MRDRIDSRSSTSAPKCVYGARFSMGTCRHAERLVRRTRRLAPRAPLEWRRCPTAFRYRGVHPNVPSRAERRRRTIMRAAARAARDAAVPATDLRGVIGAATGSAASLVEVSVMLPTWSPRVCTRADLLQQRCRTARRHRRRRSPLIRRCTTHLRERHSWCRLPCTPRSEEALQRDHTYPVLRVRH